MKKVYTSWSDVPSHLKTKTQLTKLGLTPNGEAVAFITTKQGKFSLYDKKKAKGAKNEFRDWHGKKFFILDCETTGIGNNDEIVELSIIDQSGKVVFDSLIKPTISIPRQVSLIHGISDKDVKNAPSFKSVYPKIKKVLENNLVLIYNSPFDTRMIKNNCIKLRLDEINFTSACVMKAYKEAKGLKKNVKLSEASGIYTTHRSLGDCQNTLKLIKKMWKELGL